MKYILKNLKKFAGNETAIFVIAFICVFTSAFILNFSYGLIRNYARERDSGDISLKQLDISSSPELTQAGLRAFIEALPPEAQEAADMIYAYVQGSDKATLRISFKNNSYRVSSGALSAFISGGEKFSKDVGRYFTDEELSRGEALALGGWLDESVHIGDDITLFGKSYRVIGLVYGTEPVVPLLSLPPEAPVKRVAVLFDEPISERIYDGIKIAADSAIPGMMTFPELALPDGDAQSLYANIILICVLVSALSVMNFAMLYLFIVRERRSALAVMRICGARKPQAALIYLGECLALTIPAFLLGTLFFDLLLKRAFAGIFPYMAESFSPLIYIAVFVIYTAVMLVILGVMIMKNISGKINLIAGKI